MKTARVDVASRASVHALAGTASALGDVTEIVHTAGLSPNMAPPEKILAVDLLGTALVLEEFGSVVAAGGAGVVISSMAGHMFPPLPPEFEDVLARTPADDLLSQEPSRVTAATRSGQRYVPMPSRRRSAFSSPKRLKQSGWLERRSSRARTAA